MNDFKKELTSLINKYSIENNSNTPDFILARYLQGCLDLFANIIQQRQKWYSRSFSPEAKVYNSSPVDLTNTLSEDSISNDNNEEFDDSWDDPDPDYCGDDDLSFLPPTPRPTALDVQNKLKDLTQALSVLPKIKQQVGTWEEKPALENNNDGRLTCYACGEPTKIVDTGFGKSYCVCTVCGK